MEGPALPVRRSALITLKMRPYFLSPSRKRACMDCSLPVYSRHTSSFTTYSALPSTYTRVHAHTHTYGSYELAADTPGSLHPSIHSLAYLRCLLSHSISLQFTLSLSPSVRSLYRSSFTDFFSFGLGNLATRRH